MSRKDLDSLPSACQDLSKFQLNWNFHSEMGFRDTIDSKEDRRPRRMVTRPGQVFLKEENQPNIKYVSSMLKDFGWKRKEQRGARPPSGELIFGFLTLKEAGTLPAFP
ncbi:hypothetical protein HPP92_006950 [Vanilla planifolia]|uniref:Uncharacterized protein n=1 Tax=Vanilla planifolia TaxID=51239 RepID=A0A835V962_VANPL|nr:hypothetical protein HPP92_007183 [Vanilla planifolia]KAG0490087.1 hypothetical protein HPP92_006950 [Vanilla planifolia]